MFLASWHRSQRKSATVYTVTLIREMGFNDYFARQHRFRGNSDTATKKVR
jgi:hypothetical protein